MEEKKKTKEIDLLELVIKVLQEWKLLLKFVAVAAILGVFIALSTPKYYKAEVMLAPELSSGGLGLTDNLADMAESFGISLGKKSSMDAIYPELYPDIFNSTQFVLDLFNIPVRLKDDDRPRTYYHHITTEQIIPFWDYPKIWLFELLKPEDPLASGKSKKDHYKISRDDSDICKVIRNAISCNIDKKTSVITIDVTDQDPLVAVIVADTLQKRLQEYITNYRTSKARNDLDYYKKLTAQAKENYEKVRQRYTSYADANMDLLLQSYKSKMDDLENDMQIKFNTYSTLNNQFEAAKAKVQERTPAFTIIERPIMPYKAASTPRAIIVLFFMFLGGCCDALWVLYGRKWYAKKKDGNSK